MRYCRKFSFFVIYKDTLLLCFQVIVSSCKNMKLGFFLHAHLLASRIPCFKPLQATSFLIFSVNTCRFFLSSCFCCNKFNCFTALSCENKEEPDTEMLRARLSNSHFLMLKSFFFVHLCLELFSLFLRQAK